MSRFDLIVVSPAQGHQPAPDAVAPRQVVGGRDILPGVVGKEIQTEVRSSVQVLNRLSLAMPVMPPAPMIKVGTER